MGSSNVLHNAPSFLLDPTSRACIYKCMHACMYVSVFACMCASETKGMEGIGLGNVKIREKESARGCALVAY